MYVRRMLGPERGRMTVRLDWEAVASAILSLDNHELHFIVLDAGQQDPNMTIGGGKSVWCPPGYWNARYHVTCTDAEGNWYLLSDPRISVSYPHDAELTLRLGGQESNLDADVCIYREEALQAAETFVARGGRNAHLHWIKNP